MRIETNKGFQRKGIIIDKTTIPQSYVVEVDGRKLERNRKHLRKVEEEKPVVASESETDVMEKNEAEIMPPIVPLRPAPTVENAASRSPVKPLVTVMTRSGRAVIPNQKYADKDYVK